MYLTTFYPNLQHYILEKRVNGRRKGTVRIYNVMGQVIDELRYYNDQMVSVLYQRNGCLHNLYGPALIQWDDEQIQYISYRQNGLVHNLHGPALIGWQNGQIRHISYYQNDRRHNLHGPAYVKWYNGQIITEYWRNGDRME